jgi:hypothetical protein
MSWQQPRSRSTSFSSLPLQESLGSILPEFSTSTSIQQIPAIDLTALAQSIVEAKANETLLMEKTHRLGQHRKLSSSGKSAFALPSPSIKTNTDGSPRLMDNIHTIVESPRFDEVSYESKKVKKLAKNEAKEAHDVVHDIKQVQRDMLKTLIHLQKQADITQQHVASMAKNMDSLYVVSTKQLERIYNSVDEIGRTGHITHADDGDDTVLKAHHTGYQPLGKSGAKSSCCTLV